jgi:ubiquinone biosynthesis protein UbiJ
MSQTNDLVRQLESSQKAVKQTQDALRQRLTEERRQLEAQRTSLAERISEIDRLLQST